MIGAQFRLQEIALRLADGDATAAVPALEAQRNELEALVAAEPTARIFTARLLTAWMLEARRRLAEKSSETTLAADRAIALGEQLLRESRADRFVRYDWAQARLVAGRAGTDAAQPDRARQNWERVVEVLGPLATASNDWRVLDPLAQALLLLRRPDSARPYVERLSRFGYRPIDPLAGSTLELAR